MMTGWKTFLLGLIVALAGAPLEYIANFDWTKTGASPFIVSAIGVAVMVLRYVTTTPIFKKE